MIKVENLVKIFGPDPKGTLPLLKEGLSKDEIRAKTGHTVGVNEVSFTVEPGEFFVIMGLSGSGKSTLLRCINRLIDPTAGRILVQDEAAEVDVTKLDAKGLRDVRRNTISMVFQRFGLLPHRKVRENVAFGLEVKGQSEKARLTNAQKALDMVGLKEWGDAYPDELSGGMQQRVGLARALATDAPVLLMDEPFSALDPLIKVNMQQELIRIEEQLKRTILFITHDLDEALKLGHRIAIMEGGRIVQIGTPEEIIVNPRTEYVADFVEHADPTGVITSSTIAVPASSPQLKPVKQNAGIRYFAHESRPQVLIGLDDADKLVNVIANDKKVELTTLQTMLEKPAPALRHTDVALVCRETATLKQILRGRTYSSLPTLVVDADNIFQGVITERELIWGILEKRAYQDTSQAAVSEEVAAEPVPVGVI